MATIERRHPCVASTRHLLHVSTYKGITGIRGQLLFTLVYGRKKVNRWFYSHSPEANKEKIKHFKNKEDAINFRKEMEKKYYV